MKRFWSVFFSLLMPTPLFAIESGVNAMQAASEQESITAWAYREFVELLTQARDTLEPLLPREPNVFSILDAEIASFIATGEQEQVRIARLIREIENKPEQPQEPVPDQTMVAEAVEPSTPLPIYSTAPDYMPEIEILTADGFLLDLDTSKGINLPDITITPKGGGTYETELTVLQPALDTVQFLQDQVPAPIQTAGNELYNRLTGLPDAERGTA